MRFSEAMRLLEEGKKITCKEWAGQSDQYIDKDILKSSHACHPALTYWEEEWELYVEPERTYTFMEVVNGLKEAKKFKRKHWGNWYLTFCPIGYCIYIQGIGFDPSFTPYGMLNFEATDWLEA